MKLNNLILTALALVASASLVHAGSHTWSGAGANRLWSNPANWSAGGPPSVGEGKVALVFPAVATSRNSTNNLVGLTLNAVNFAGNGYKVGGNAVTLGGGSAGFDAAANTTNTWDINVVLSALNNTFAIGNKGMLHFSGALSGASGFAKTGTGALRLAPAVDNSYAGPTLMLDGQLVLSGAGALFSAITVPGPLVIGENNAPAGKFPLVIYEQPNQIAEHATVTILEDGYLNLFGQSDAIGALVLQGGGFTTVNSGNAVVGTLTLNGNVTCLPFPLAASGRGRLSLGGAERTFEVPDGSFLSLEAVITHGLGTAGIVKAGGGTMFLFGANVFNGFTKVNAGTLMALRDGALGTIANGTFVATGATLMIADANLGTENFVLAGAGVGGTNGALQLIGTNTLSGVIQLVGRTVIHTVKDASTDTAFTFTGVVNGSGALIKTGGGTLTLAGAANNTFSGGAEILEGAMQLNKTVGVNALPGPVTVGATNGPNYTGILRHLASHQIADTAPVRMNTNGLFDVNSRLETIGSLDGAGNLNLVLGTLTTGGNNANTEFHGSISGIGVANALVKEGTGSFILNGTSSYTGKTVVNNGHLYVQGSQPGSGIVLNPNGRLHGQGAVGAISGAGGWAVPGDFMFAPNHGSLKSGSLALDAASDFNIDLAGVTEGVDYNQLRVIGTVNLGNAQLHLSESFPGAVSNQFVLIRNDGADAVAGMFNGLPEGAVFDLGPNRKFHITYAGGDGNDVVLTQVFAPQAANISKLLNFTSHIELTATGTPGGYYQVQANTDLNTTNWVLIGQVVADAQGLMSIADQDSTNHPIRFYRFVAP